MTSVAYIGAEERRSDRESVAGAYRRHRDRIYRLALRYGSGREAWAEDITQDVFITLWEHIGGLSDPDDVEGWLYRVTTNLCLTRLQRERFLSAPAVRWLFGDRDESELETTIMARSELRRAMQTVDSLPPPQRVAFCMYYLDGKDQAEIGAILGHSKSYVCKLIAKADAKVRRSGWKVNDA